MSSPPQCPATPPRRHVARFSSFGHVTPKSIRSSHRKSTSVDSKVDSFASPHKSPFFSPRPSKRNPRSTNALSGSRCDASLSFLPTPLATGSSRKVKLFSDLVEPSRNSRSLTASLEALAREDQKAATFPTNNASKSPILRTPSPRPSLYNENDPFSDSDSDILVMREEDLKNISRFNMPNPFIELNLSTKVENDDKGIDLSTHMELINHRTGKKIVQKLSEEEKGFKPRKLVFTQDVEPVVNYNVANRFLDKNMGRKFTMEGEGKLGFSIFSDDDNNDDTTSLPH